MSGQFFDHPDGGQWIHFLTEPVVVSVSPDGPAAGRLRSGDVVASVDGRLITTLEGSRRFAFGTEAPIRLDVRRSGESVEVAVSPEITCEGTAPSRITRGRSGRSGFRLRCRECGLEGGRWRFSSPPIVTAVLPGSPAARAGLSIGDVLVAVDGAALTTDTGAERFSALSAGERVVWTVRRGGEELRLTWTIGEGGTER
ncbi:MAG: PDZ domain-containing protein [Gemmatimonadota bacterium]|nr:PDZ domain-containing protein [Gemmatimonadota bacterium]